MMNGWVKGRQADSEIHRVFLPVAISFWTSLVKPALSFLQSHPIGRLSMLELTCPEVLSILKRALCDGSRYQGQTLSEPKCYLRLE